MSPSSAGSAAGTVHLLDGNVLYALVDEAHVHHAAAQQWFVRQGDGRFATCPITQGTLLRPVICIGERSAEQAMAVLNAVTAHARHQFWPDALGYQQVRWRGVFGHRQATARTLLHLPATMAASWPVSTRGWWPCIPM